VAEGMGCLYSSPAGVTHTYRESDMEKSAHVRRKTQHLIQNLVHEEYRLKVDEVNKD
jgi:hypothetical protein